ncbi:uncharacterized protein [Musca autumnalis]|uniref:uncharacterized protein n=1 Tax=Musca autumnalis TaxID=221902 RepID=UPI003CF7B8F4
MSGLKLIKTTFQTRKEIVAVKFDGINDHNLFVNEVKKTYNISPLTDVEVLNKEFPIKPHIFTDFVLQYISTDFILDIKLAYNETNLEEKPESKYDFESQTCSESSLPIPNPQHLPIITKVYSCTQNDDITESKYSVDTTPPSPTILSSTNGDISKRKYNVDINVRTPAIIPSAEAIREFPEMRPYLKMDSLKNIDRSRIAKAIIKNILGSDLKKQILKDDFLKLSVEVVDIFPFEKKETYYIPFTKGRLPRGKLYDAYNNYRRKLMAPGLKAASENSESVKSYNVSQEKHCYNNESTTIHNEPSTILSVQQIRHIPAMIKFLNRQSLENSHRIEIAKAIAEFILNRNPKRQLIREDFLQLSQSIVEIFPFEKAETYYMPYFKGRLSRGKLYNAYYNYRAQLCADGITRSSNSNPESNCESIETHSNFAQQINDLKSEPCDDLEFETCSSSSMSCIDNAEASNLNQNHYIDNTGELFDDMPSVERIKQIPEITELLNYKTLQNKNRIKIAKAIIEFLLNPNPNRQLLKQHYLHLSQAIVDIFPLETKETYYIPYSKGKMTKGKLYDAYTNHRTKLCAAGLITRRSNSRPKKNGYDESLTRINETITPHELDILIAMDSDWNAIKDLWRKSYSHRRKELLNDKISTQIYLNHYNIPKLNENYYDLLQIDFNILYSSTKNISEWKIYYPKVIAMFQESCDTNVNNILAKIDKTNDEDSKLALSLMLIPYMLPILRVSKLASQESFICYKISQNAYDNNESPAKRIKTETQPKIYFIGDAGVRISAAYLDLFGNRFKFENPLKAVEACFYCYTTMNIKYPQTCHYTWIFLQKIIYEIETPHDVEIPAVNTLINDLKRED